MSSPISDSGCFKWNLKIGAIVVGIFDSAISTIFLIIGITISGGLSAYVEQDLYDRSHIRIIYATLIASAVFSAILLIASILLVIGSVKGRYTYLLPWITFIPNYVCFIIVYVSIILGTCIDVSNIGMFIASMASTIIGICLHFYFFMAIYSFYKCLKSAESTTIDSAYLLSSSTT